MSRWFRTERPEMHLATDEDGVNLVAACGLVRTPLLTVERLSPGMVACGDCSTIQAHAEAPPPERPDRVVDLMAALEQSVAEARSNRKRKPR